jgi:hypothetical protein
MKPDRAGAPEHIPTKRKAIERLAAFLFWELERLDPTGNFEMSQGVVENWASLPETERELYVAALQRVLQENDLIKEALGER